MKKYFHIKLTKIIFWPLVLAASLCLAQEEDPSDKIREQLSYYLHHPLADKDLQNLILLFGGYDKATMANRLISVFKEQAALTSRISFDNKVEKIYSSLHLPWTGISDALDAETVPRMKWRLMRLYGDSTDAPVIASFLRQLTDKRTAWTVPEDTNGEYVEALRVCDVACDHLVQNLTGGLNVLTERTPMRRRDAIIASTLEKLKLNAP